jgi:hypothetical protein
MDKADRIEFLKNLMAEDPDDPFAPYALCLESEGNPAEKASKWLDFMAKFPLYLPAFYQTGLALKQSGQVPEALDVWKKGIELALTKSDTHAAAEIRSALQNALLEDDDD